MADEFFIRSKLNGMVIDIRGASTDAGAELITYPQKTADNANQRWRLVDAGEGAYHITSSLNGDVIDIPGGDTSAGTRLIVWPRNEPPSDNQRWTLVPAGDDFYITSKLHGFVIDIHGGDTGPGAPLIAYPTNAPPSPNQLWTLSPVPKPGVRVSEWEDNLDNWFTRRVTSRADPSTCSVLGPVMLVELRGPWLLHTPSGDKVDFGPMSGRFYLPDLCALQATHNDCVCSGFRLADKHHTGASAGPNWPL